MKAQYIYQSQLDASLARALAITLGIVIISVQLLMLVEIERLTFRLEV